MKHWLAWALGSVACNLVATAAVAANPNGQVAGDVASSLSAESAATGAATAVLSTAGTAAESAPDVSANDWEVSFTPYLWMSSLKGDISIPRANDEAEVDQSFSDILGDLKFAFMGTLDVNYRRFVMHTDTIYLSLGADVDRVDSLIFNEGEFDAKILILTGALGYRVIDRGPTYVDLYAGGRLASLDIDLSLTGPLQTREASASPSNISPLVGGKTRIALSDRWALALQGDIGFDSDVKWQLAGSVQYQLSNHWRLGAGYRHLALHHDTHESEFDIALSGPLLAVTYIF